MTPWALISGEQCDPKARCALEVASELEARGISVGGVVQRSRGSDGAKSSELVRVAGGARVPLAQEGIAPRGASEEAFCSYAFRLDAFAQARRWLEEDLADRRVLILGDLSKLEVAGRGHAESLRRALSLGEERLLVLTVRTSQLGYLMGNYALESDPVASLQLPDGPGERRAFVDALLRFLERR